MARAFTLSQYKYMKVAAYIYISMYETCTQHYVLLLTLNNEEHMSDGPHLSLMTQ